MAHDRADLGGVRLLELEFAVGGDRVCKRSCFSLNDAYRRDANSRPAPSEQLQSARSGPRDAPLLMAESGMTAFW
jgi:hypothetical protein